MKAFITVPGQVVRGTRIKGERPNAVIVKNTASIGTAKLTKWLYEQIFNSVTDFVILSKNNGAISDYYINETIKALENIPSVRFKDESEKTNKVNEISELFGDWMLVDIADVLQQVQVKYDILVGKKTKEDL